MHKSPIFISGIGRSGTSAVISSLAKHHSVVEPNRVGEAPIVGHFINFLIDYEDNSPHRDYHLKNYQLDSDGRDKAYSDLLSSLQYGFDINSSDDSEKFWIAKVSLGKEAYDKAASIFKELRVIYVMRNGVEVVNSAKSFHGFADLTFEQLCTRWVSNLDTCRYVHSAKHCAVIRHDELVSDPETVYRNVYNELSIEHDPAPASFIGTTLFNSSFDKSATLKSTAGVFNNRLGCWENWTKEEQDIFERICDKHMIEFGFQRPYASGFVPKPTQEPETVRPNINLTTESASPLLKSTVDTHMNLVQLNYFANVSTNHSYLFIENPKVASTSILKTLQENEDKDIASIMANPHVREASPIARLSEFTTVEQDTFFQSDEFYRFAFVRNPLMRLLSAYLSKIDKPLKAKAEILGILKGVKPKEITNLKEKIDFQTFVDVVCSQESYKMNPHWRAQTDQIMIEEINYHFVGRFENLEADYNQVMLSLFPDLSSTLTQSRNKTNSQSRFDEFYTQDLIDKVYAKFYDDFQAFEYSKTSLMRASA